MFSGFGLAFLIVIGILLQKQPLYIKGVMHPAEAAQNCYLGGKLSEYLYLCIFIAIIARLKKNCDMFNTFNEYSRYILGNNDSIDSILGIR